MTESLEFKTGTEWHLDTGEVWTGYLVDTESQNIQSPDKCCECKRKFQNRREWIFCL